MKRLSHIGSGGKVQMVDVSPKPQSLRIAIATGKIKINRATAAAISRNKIAKGNVLATAQIAGIQAAKRTAELIPLCHSLSLSNVAIDFEIMSDAIAAKCIARTTAQTGVEMEALTGTTVALLTIYDMCKAIDKKMEISEVRLVEKRKMSME
ncbi:MAG TPA: cyclic pyranopterin monophosphate synthase MoaC [Chthoniobacterales bacterium]|nr:cyclic pyranopterin monophosphate synthase MoaC [Chthoniobacterales bacterium]